MKDWVFQDEAVKAIIKDITKGLNPLLIMATGTGKTHVFSYITKICLEYNMKILILAHTEELINQAIAKIYKITGEIPDKEQAKHWASTGSNIVVGSVQTMQRKRLERWKPDHFQLIIIDEAHHAVSQSYMNIINYFVKYALLGVTATPDRADEKELGQVFNHIAYEYPLYKAIKEGYLVNIIGKRVTDLDIDLTQLRVSGKDYSDVQLGEVLLKYIIPLANSIKKETANYKTLIFMPDVKSSAVMAEQLRRIELNADYLSGDRSSERGDILYKFKTGATSHLVSCNILLEGFDEPSIESIVMLRPTTSRTLYSQAIGRGTRLNPGKEELKLIEFTYNSSKLNLVQPYELFASKDFNQRIRESANSTDGECYDLLKILEEAKETWNKPENLSKRLITKEYGFQQFDPFSVAELFGSNISGEFDIEYQGQKVSGVITPKQIDILNRYGVHWDNLDKAQASKIISLYSEHGYYPIKDKATRNQKWFLTNNKYKYDKHLMKAQASVIIDMIKSGKLNFKDH